MIKIQRSNEPKILQSKGREATHALCERYNQGKRSFKDKSDFKRSIYAHPSVKNALFKMQHGKCCFCECIVTCVGHTATGDVEHFRPKAGYQQHKQDNLHQPGYYWLTYDWNNLLLSCEDCNRIYKKNLFPLANADKRATNHHNSIDEETPLLINPCTENPENFIGFNEDVPYAINDNLFGKSTIAILNLETGHNGKLREERRKVLDRFNQQLHIIKKAANKPEDQDWQQLAAEAKQLIQKMASPQAKYSAMIKAATTSFYHSLSLQTLET